jgi:uncharacterized protein
MKLIPLLLLVGMLAVSGLAQNGEYKPYSAELVKKAEAGDAVAQWSLGSCYKYGNGVKINKEESLGWYTKSAEQGNAEAQYELRNYYCIKANEYVRTTDNLPLIEEARKTANEWCLKAADGGNRNAQYTLGSYYYFGSRSKGAARIVELEEAKKWYTKVADSKMVGQCEEAIKKVEALKRIEKKQ